MQKITMIGVCGGFALLMVGVVMDGTSPGALIQIPAMIIVVIPTLMVSLAGLSADDIPLVKAAMKKAFGAQESSAGESIGIVVKMAEQARKEGLLALEDSAKNIEDPFLKKGIDLAVDGTDPEELREILEAGIRAKKTNDKIGSKFFADAGGFSPTFGIVGAVVGLIHVLGNLSDPAAAGLGIASAFVATFYGLIMANVVYLPISNKLKRISDTETNHMELLLEGILSIQAGSNPRIVEQKLKSYLSAREREELEEEAA